MLALALVLILAAVRRYRCPPGSKNHHNGLCVRHPPCLEGWQMGATWRDAYTVTCFKCADGSTSCADGSDALRRFERTHLTAGTLP